MLRAGHSAGLKGAPCSNLNTEVSDTGTVPKVNLTYKPSNDAMVYATYSKGFRPGGVNRVTIAGFPPYKADYLTNYEVGWKTQWFDHRLRWNGALFWEDWKNFQFSFLVPPSITAIANGGNARIKGIENEFDWVATDHLLLTSNLTWLDPVLTQNYCGTLGRHGLRGPGHLSSRPTYRADSGRPAGTGGHQSAGGAEVQGQHRGPLYLGRDQGVLALRAGFVGLPDPDLSGTAGAHGEHLRHDAGVRAGGFFAGGQHRQHQSGDCSSPT